ncbi:IMPACT family protein [Flavilitoribacter nigricans]|uniref:YigZ family protein n=1 Tax=Flavilitoribacter nigricans (strain ATCC 23147 / DSM 23189 / NBRC 102662 / NCIMB 1420 / SS-2) TaxID=1122177 RepID=A0A2D0N3D7_FLAN2|nr:YigZ family protein [Flavilitoribacter nigricans]PHN02957.1 YigZ family protein [Flavilitoribacter nigricans DSM 23189 = NBRC 102662]
MEDAYQTIAGPSTGEFRDRGSKFLAYAYPVYDEETINEHLLELKKLHPKARHHCYAWRLGTDGLQFRANDDGEPSGTAGRPILGQIDSFELTNVFVVVVRYFGGTKLGTSGLINAYKVSTAAALEAAEIEERLLEAVYQVEFEYSLMSDVMNAVKQYEVEIIKQEFTDKGYLQIAIRLSETEEKLMRIRAQIAGAFLEEKEKWETIEGLEIEYKFTR